MAIWQSLKTVGVAALLAFALATGMAGAADKKGQAGTKHEAMKAHHERMAQLAKQLSEHTQMMKGLQDRDRLDQEMIRHQEMIDQMVSEMIQHHEAMMKGMMGGQHKGEKGKGHTHQGGKGSMMQHGSGGMMEHQEKHE